jgi:DNA mismatch endonuclease, patch repair protein
MVRHLSGEMARQYTTLPVGPSPSSKSGAVRTSMKSNKASGTKPEVIVSRILRKKLLSTNLPGRPDFVYRHKKVVIFVHGCFWHRCPVCNLPLPESNSDFWKRKFERNVERDRLVNKELRGSGWKVVEVWEHEIKENLSLVRQRVRSVLESSSAPD